VKNYEAWCTIAVNGETASTAAVQTVCVAANGTVPVTAAPANASFELGPKPWHDTTGDTGTGDPGTVSGGVSSTTATVTTGTKCVWACCPFTNGTGCPTTDQCP
jgi:hypothetical protein